MQEPAYSITDAKDVEKQESTSSCLELIPPYAAILTYEDLAINFDQQQHHDHDHHHHCCNRHGSRHSYQNKTKRLRDNKAAVILQRLGLLKIARDLHKLARESRELQCEIDKLREDVKGFENHRNRAQKIRNVGLVL